MAEIAVTREGTGSSVPNATGYQMTHGLRVSWGAIFAGLVIASALQIVFTILGLAIGLGSIDASDSARAAGIGAGLWATITALISLFVGGMTAGRLAGARTSGDGALHGIVMWSLSTLLAVWLIASGVSSVAGGVFRMAGNVLGGTTAGMIQGAAQVGTTAAQQPQLAQRTANSIDSAAQSMRHEAAGALDNAQTTAQNVASGARSVATGASWLALIALILTAGAAALGGARTARPTRP